MRLHRICQKIGVWKSHCNFLFLCKSFVVRSESAWWISQLLCMSTSILYKGREAVSALKSSTTTMTTTSSLCSLKFLNKCNLGKIHLLTSWMFLFYFSSTSNGTKIIRFWELWKIWAHENLLHILINHSSLCISPDIFSDKLYQKMPLWQWAGTEKKGSKFTNISKQSSLNVSAIVCMMQLTVR